MYIYIYIFKYVNENISVLKTVLQFTIYGSLVRNERKNTTQRPFIIDSRYRYFMKLSLSTRYIRKKMEYYLYGIRTTEPNPLESFSREMGRNSLKYQKIYRLDVAGKIAKKSSGTSVRSSSPLENDL